MATERAPADPAIEARRTGARRTAWAVAAVALAIYVGFMLTGMVGR